MIEGRAPGSIDDSRSGECRIENRSPFVPQLEFGGGKPIHVIQQNVNAELIAGAPQEVRHGHRMRMDLVRNRLKTREVLFAQIVRTTIPGVPAIDVNPPEVIVL